MFRNWLEKSGILHVEKEQIREQMVRTHERKEQIREHSSMNRKKLEGLSTKDLKAYGHVLLKDIEIRWGSPDSGYIHIAKTLKVHKDMAHFSKIRSHVQLVEAVIALQKMVERQRNIDVRRAQKASKIGLKPKKLPEVTLPLSEQRKALQKLVQPRRTWWKRLIRWLLR